MAHLAGVYCHQPSAAEQARNTWQTLQRALGTSNVAWEAGPIKLGVFRHYPDEQLVSLATVGEVEAQIGFGGAGALNDEASAAPPWLRCRYEPKSQKLVVATDRYGFALVYVRRMGSCTTFSTSASLLGRLSPALSLDPSGLAELLAFDHLLEQRTLRVEVSAAPAGHDLEIAPAGVSFRKRHCHGDLPLEPAKPELVLARTAISQLRAAISSTIGLANAGCPVMLPLSGGLDSRLLAVLARDAGAVLETFTFGSAAVEGILPPDVSIAEKVARQLGVPWRFLELPDDWLVDHALEATRLTDGHLNMLHSAGVSVRQLFNTDRLRLDGIGGDVLFGGAFLRDSTFQSLTRHARLDDLWHRYFRLDAEPWRSILLPAARNEIWRRARDALLTSLDCTTEGSRAEDPRWFDFWVLRNRTRRFINNGPLLWRACARSAFAFLVPKLADQLLSMHPRARQGGRLQRLVFQAGWPEMASIPWQKNGRPLRRPGLFGAVLHALTPPAYPKGRAFFSFDTAFQKSPRMQRFFSDCLLDAHQGIERFGCFDRAGVERLLEDAATGRRNGMRQIALLASLVLADRHWSSTLPEGGP